MPEFWSAIVEVTEQPAEKAGERLGLIDLFMALFRLAYQCPSCGRRFIERHRLGGKYQGTSIYDPASVTSSKEILKGGNDQ